VTAPTHVPPELSPIFDALVSSPDAIFVTDRQNRIVFWNLSAEKLLGYTAGEMVGAPCAARLQGCDSHGNRYCADDCPINQTAKRGETVRHFGLQLRALDGHVLSMDISILHLALRSPGGFCLAHVLRPSPAPLPAARTAEQPAVPPRSALSASRDSPDARVRKLTSREVEVLGMLAAGRTTPEIADRLHISTLTARNHIQNILDKLELHSKAEAVAFAFQKGLL
jgi:DNA-binding CsgD family transcriptional regulator